jgi:hypothetical protein
MTNRQFELGCDEVRDNSVEGKPKKEQAVTLSGEEEKTLYNGSRSGPKFGEQATLYTVLSERVIAPITTGRPRHVYASDTATMQFS